MSIPIYQLGWMAGIIDLKGRIIRKNNQSRATQQITLMVETKELAVAKGLGRMTGTNPEFRHQSPLSEWMRRGCAEHCPEQHIHHSRDDLNMPAMARWTISGAPMVVILENLAPFLLIDRGYELATHDARNGLTLTGKGSGAVSKALRRLEALGWELPEDFKEDLEDLQSEQVAA